MQQIGEWLGKKLHGGEVFELIGDVGAGKTTFTRGLARGLGISEQVQSPTFTINREYQARDGLRLVHYDFYRLGEAGIMAEELAETLEDPRTVSVIEWSAVAEDILPLRRITATIRPVAGDDQAREIEWQTEDKTMRALLEECQRVFAA